jgi:hypothetical protein
MRTEQNTVICQTMTMLKNFAKFYLALDLVVIIVCVISNNYLWLLNTQIAFISAMAITIGSFLGYKRNIENRVQGLTPNRDNEIEPRDKIDEIDDPYDLYGEINEQEEFSTQEIKAIIEEEKKKIKQNSFKNTIFSATGFASLYRLSGYAILIFGFFALNNNGLLHVFSYVSGLLIVTLATLMINASSKSVADQ